MRSFWLSLWLWKNGDIIFKDKIHYSDRSQILVISHKAEFTLRHVEKGHDKANGLAIQIVYKKGKDNVAADALSKVAHLQALQAVSMVRLDWVQEVINSYATDSRAQQLLAQLAITSPNADGYTL